MSKLKPLSKETELKAVPLDEPVLVELEPATPGSAKPEHEEQPERAEREPKTRQKRESDDPGVTALQKQLADAQAAIERTDALRAAAEEKARRHAQEAEEARQRSGQTERSLAANSLEAAQAEAAAAKAAYKVAFEAGDGAAMADAQEKIGRAAAKVLRFEETVAGLDEEAKRTKAEGERQPVQRHTDVNASIDAIPNLLPKERAWLKEHPELMLDQAKNAELGVGYNRAVAKGLTRGTDAYFKFIEEFMGMTNAAGGEAEDDVDPPVSAPVSRGGAASMSGKTVPSRIELTPKERELAALAGLTDVEYARGKQQMNADKQANPDKYAGR